MKLMIMFSLIIFSLNLFSLDTTLVTTDMNINSIYSPGRKIMCHGDTVSVIYTATTSDPNFQRLYQTYSTDKGLTWTQVLVGMNDAMEISAFQKQIKVNQISSACSYVLWTEKIYPSYNNIYFTYDALTPFQNFTPVEIDDSLHLYNPNLAVWGEGDTLLAAALDVETGSILMWFSTDHGSNWIQINNITSATSRNTLMLEQSNDGYCFMFYGEEIDTSDVYIPMYMESTDYGYNWTSPETLMFVVIDNDTLSIDDNGFDCYMFSGATIPYVTINLVNNNSVNKINNGEIYFIKPNGGSPGSYSFDFRNPTPVYTGFINNVFEEVADCPTIGYVYDYFSFEDNFYIIFSAQHDSILEDSSQNISNLYMASSVDFGNTWNVARFTNSTDTNNQFYYSSVTQTTESGTNLDKIHIIATIGGNNFNPGNLDHIKLYHLSEYFTGVEENISTNEPSSFHVSVRMTGNLCVFNLNLTEAGLTEILIYDSSGRNIGKIFKGNLNTGNNNIHWRTDEISNGTYFYKVYSNNYCQTGKMILLR